MLSPYSPYPLACRVMGPDSATLRAIADKMEAMMQAIPMMRTVNTDWLLRVPTLHFSLSQDRLQAGYLADRPEVAHPQDIMQHACLRQRLPGGKRYHWEYQQHEQQFALDVPRSLTLDSSALMVEAAVAGLAVAHVPEPYARQALDTKRLVTLPEDWTIASQGIALYFPQNRHMPVALRLFVDTVKAAMRV